MEQKVKTSEEKVREIIAEVVKAQVPSFDNESLKTMIEESVIKAVATETEKAKKIEVEDNFEKDPKGGFKSMAQFFRDVARFDKSGGRMMSKELDKWETHVKAAGTGISEGDAQYAGHLVPVEFRNNLMVLIEESNDILPRCTTIPMGSNIIEVPVAWGFDESAGLVFGGVKWYWTDELGEYTSSRPRVEKIQMKLKKLAGLAYISDELIEDSPQSVEALVKRGFQSGLNFALNNGFIRGTGAGQMQGILNAPATVSVTKEVGQAAATIVFENVIKMYTQFYGGSGVWVCNPNCLPQLASMSLAVGTGGVPVWMPAGGASGLPYSTLFGLPVLFNDHCSALGTVGDIILADWSQYWVGRKAGMEGVKYTESMHVMFLYDQQAMKFSIRLDGQVSWPTYFTPPQSTTTYKSPFITLATRA